MFTTYRFGPNGHMFVEVIVTGTLGAYLLGQATHLLHEGHVLPETHAECLVMLSGSTPSFEVSSGVAGGADAATWNHGVWNRGRWGT